MSEDTWKQRRLSLWKTVSEFITELETEHEFLGISSYLSFPEVNIGVTERSE